VTLSLLLVRLEGEGQGTRGMGPGRLGGGDRPRVEAEEWTHTHTRTHAPMHTPDHHLTVNQPTADNNGQENKDTFSLKFTNQYRNQSSLLCCPGTLLWCAGQRPGKEAKRGCRDWGWD
jgi:hypothetical protein